MANSLVVRKGASLAENHAAVIATCAHAHNPTLVETYRYEGESGLQLRNGPVLSSS